MLNKIVNFFNQSIQPKEAGHDLVQLNRAAAVLLIEVSEADEHFCDKERAELNDLLFSEYQLNPQQIEEITLLAKEEKSRATGMYQFTRLINEHFGYEEKIRLMMQLWKVAYADSVLDKYEEYTIRKIADLLYINHSDYTLTKKQSQKT